MSLGPIVCPGCEYAGHPHLTTCKNGQIPPIPGIYVPGSCVPVMPVGGGECVFEADIIAKAAEEIAEGERLKAAQAQAVNTEYITQNQVDQQAPVREVIEQKVLPSSGTKLVCTTCGRADWHFLILRRKAGLLEGLCKQMDGSGCYPLATRRTCQYTYPEQIDCPQLSEYVVASGTQRLNPKHACRDHVGEMLRQGPLYQVWPLED